MLRLPDVTSSPRPRSHHHQMLTLLTDLAAVAGAGEELKLGDFGLTMSMKQELAISPVGTVEYMAPEVRAVYSTT